MSSSWFSKLKEKKDKRSSGARWLEDNWTTVVSLLGIFIVALVVRAYFAFDLATEFGTPYLLGGGADSHYNARIINYIVENNEHLFSDPLRTYPLLGGENVRPPLYQWSVVLGGHVLAPFVGNLDTGVQLSFIFSAGFWGALTTFPVYLIGKRTFGKKAGIAGAFLLAISAGHLERGVITNTNHDAFTLFFVVTAFYFFMRTLEEIPDDKNWVTDWMDRDKIKEGLSQFFGNNKRALLYSAMTGMCLGTVALTWKGYAYAVVIILVYFLIQLLIDKFRERDSLGITVSIFIATMIAFAIALPWYATHRPYILSDFIRWPLENWYQAPLLLSLGAFGVGVYFTVTRDLPWVLTFGVLAVVGVIFFALAPDLVQSIAGQYFIDNKLYATIAEAQAPMFSRLVMAGGVATFFLSWLGIAFAVWHVIGNWTKSFVFILVWAAFSVYMTTQAARFIFTAAPAYALTAGWVVALVFEKTDFAFIGKRFRSHRGSIFRGVKEGVKVRHILVSLLVVFLLLMPNTLTALDAGIPYEEKERYESQLQDALPSALRADPEDEAVEGQQAAGGRHLGAFGYSLDKPTDYWQVGWEWLREENTDKPPEERPAFLSWWDYGFEAMNQGEHPTVADNFQHGYRLAGNVLMSQNESEMLSLMVGRQLQLPYNEEDGFEEDGKVREILIDHLGNETTEKLEDIYDNPASYRNEVLSNPDRYHPRADDIDNRNVKWAMVMGTLSYESVETLSSLYRDVSLNSGYERLENRIGYLAVDSRLFPTGARDTGIFYAPAKLSGHRIEGERQMRTPVDFYTMELIDQEGRAYESQEDVPPEAQIVDQRIDFKDMFYNSALYRIFAGFEGQEVGEEEGIPGIDHEMIQPMPGWNLTHFKMEHRTAYFNPYPRDEVENHTDAWRAMPLEEAREYEEDENVTVDTSGPSYLRQGVVFLRYYDNAILRGQATTEDDTPISGAQITILDENGIPRHTTRTDADGYYKTFLPEGEVTVTLTTGGISEDPEQQDQQMGMQLDPQTQQKMMKQEDIQLAQREFDISLDQAMRKEIDTTGDGRWDYELEEDFEIEAGSVSGRVFRDRDGTGVYDEENDTLAEEGKVILESLDGALNYTVEIDNGTYEKDPIAPGKYTAEADIPGSETIEFTVEPGEDVGGADNPADNPETQDNPENPGDQMVDPGDEMLDPGAPPEEPDEDVNDIPISVGNLRGNVTYSEGIEEQETIELSLLESGKTAELTLGETVNYTFDSLISGEYILEVKDEGYALSQGPLEIEIGEREEANVDRRIEIVRTQGLKGSLTREEDPVPNQKLTILARGYNRVITTDDDGEFDIKLPEGAYNIYGTNRKGDETYVHIGEVTVDLDSEADERYEGEFEEAYKLKGQLEYEGDPAERTEVFIRRDSGGEYYLTTNQDGRFTAHLPEGDYTIYGMREFMMEMPGDPDQPPDQSPDQPNLYFIDEIRMRTDKEINMEGSEGRMIRGNVERQFYPDVDETSERLFSTIEAPLDGITFMGKTDIAGNYQMVLPDEETELTFSKEGYHEKTVLIEPEEDAPDTIYLEAKNITLEGIIDIVDETEFDRKTPESWSIEFEPVSDGASGKELTVEEDRYEVDLQPGEYRITAEESLVNDSVRYEIDDSFSMRPGDNLSIEKDLSPIYRVKVEGNITDHEGDPISAEIHFSGREHKNISANESYEVYLQPGNYSVRALNDDQEISSQKRLSLTEPLRSDIGLEKPVEVRRYLTHDGERKDDIPVTFKNNESGYIVRTTTEDDGNFNLSLVDGEYRIKVDFTTEEEIDGMNRRVHYILDETIDEVGRSRELELDRKIFNSTLSGHIALEDTSISDIEIEILSEDGELERSLRTDEQGYFETELVHGQYSIYVQHRVGGELYAIFESFEMPAENKEVDLVLEEGVVLTGSVNLNGERTEVDELTIERNGAVKTFSTYPDGEYRIIVPKGRYNLISETERDIEYGLTSFRAEDDVELNHDKSHHIRLGMVEEYDMELEGLETKTASQDEIVHYTATIRNTGNTRDEYELSTEETGWDIDFSPKSFHLDAGGSRTVELEVHVDENATVDDTVEFTLTSLKSGETIDREVPLEIRRFHGVELSEEIVNQRYSRGMITMSVNLTNTGNGPDGFDLRVLNRDVLNDHGWSVHIEGDTEEIGYQETEEIELRLEAVSPSPKRNVEIRLRASSSSQPTVTDTESFRASTPRLSIDYDSLDMESDVAGVEEDTFSLATWQWAAIIIGVVTVAIYVAKKKRWI